VDFFAAFDELPLREELFFKDKLLFFGVFFRDPLPRFAVVRFRSTAFAALVVAMAS
jgi:hypothetical protein